MAQNAVKKSSISAAQASKKAKRNPAPLGPKRGARVIAPKKQKLIARHKLLKKHTAGVTALTERSLAEKAGHLELLAGGKKDRKVKEGDGKK